MKKIIYFAILSLTLLSCSKFDSMNENPYALKEAPAEAYIHNIVFKTQYSLINVFRSTTSQLMQYAINTNTESTSRVVANYSIPEATDDDIWTTLYIQYGNAFSMYEQAVKENNPTAIGIADILKAMTITLITDVYGNVPFGDAGKITATAMEEGINYSTRYDDQKDIYRGIVKMFEEANEKLSDPAGTDVSPICDLMFGGSKDKWRRFGNALYLRTLVRIANKVLEESDGIFEYDVENGESINVCDKIAEMYACYISNTGSYPMMRSIEDDARVGFSQYNATLNTPFYSTTSGIWNGVAACQTLARRMLDTTESVDADGVTYYAYKSVEKGGHVPDPRWDCYYRKVLGAPTQLLHNDIAKFMKTHISSAGNSLVGRMPNGDATSAISGLVFDVKNRSYYNLFNYSEQLFLFAEAGARGWVTAASGLGAYIDLFKNAITANILEWNPYVTAESQDVIDYVNYKVNGDKYSGQTFNSSNAVEAILTEKWVALYFIGVESWCDYRRTGYPLLKTNGPAAENKGILPTRMRYPADEAYRNVVYFQEAVDGWLGGTNNMQTDVWWADTAESRSMRLKGRQ